jgi:hypothetical protein
MTRPKLRAVASEPEPEAPIDIYAAIKAKRESIDWSAVHVAGDRARPITLPVGWRVRR